MNPQPISGIITLTTLLATVIFRYHKSDTYEPEFFAALSPNNKTRETAIMRCYRARLTLQTLCQELREAKLSPATRRLAEDRIILAEPYIDDQANLLRLLKPGRTMIVDLWDEWLEKEDALRLFVVIMKTFSQAKYVGKDFNKLMVFDEVD